jgi:hypothetical protein
MTTRLLKRMVMAFVVRDMTICPLTHENPGYKMMTPSIVLGRIINHQMFQEEANYIKSLSKVATSSRKQDITLKANKKSKKKQVLEESSSDIDDDGNDSSE